MLRRRWEWTRSDRSVVVVVLLLLAYLQLEPLLPGDDRTRAGIVDLLRSGEVPQGRKYSFVQPLLSLPFVEVLSDARFGLRSFTLISWSWVAGWSALVWGLLRRERDGRYATTAVVLCLVSLLGAYVVGFNGDLFTALAMGGGVLLAYLGRSRPARTTGWALAVLGAANTPAMMAGLAVIALVAAVQRRRLRYLAVVPAALAVTAAEATWVEGSLRLTKYESGVEFGNVTLLPWGEVTAFGWPLWSGLLAVLFSFGRGLVFFLPLWVAGPPPSRPDPDELHRAERALWWGVVVMIPIYATWWAWYGGVTFGPRFFLLGVIPTGLAAARVLAGPRPSTLRLTVLLAAIALSTWIAIAGVVFGLTDTAFTTCVSGGTFELEPLCWYTPEYSSLWIPIWAGDGVDVRTGLFAVAALVAVGYVVHGPVRRLASTARRHVARRASELRSGWRF